MVDKPFPKRTVSELVAEIKLNPQKNFLVVEGVTDKLVISRLFDSLQKDVIIQPASQLKYKSKINYGEKGKVLKLVDISKKDALTNCVAIIDRDTDLFVGIDHRNEHCLYYDYMQLDWYGITEKKLMGSINGFCRVNISEVELGEIIDDSYFVTSIRVFRDKYCSSVALPKIKSYFVGNSHKLDRNRYLCAFMSSSDKTPKHFQMCQFKQQGNSKPDFRHNVHFKDMRDVLFFSLKNSKKIRTNISQQTIAEAFRNILFTCDVGKYRGMIDLVSRI